MHPQGNIFSYIAPFVWIPVALWVARRWPPAKAAALLFLIPMMFLPERIDFNLPGLPVFDKHRIAIFWLLIAVLLFHRQRLATVRLGKWVKLAILVVLGASIVTVLLNSDPISDGSVYLPSHTPYDAVNLLLSQLLDHILPFALAVAMFKSPKDLRVFFRILVGAALAYSILQIVELNLSPQLHRWMYGFHQHKFHHALRGDGYRPMVFMSNGLAVAMLTLAGVLAAGGLYKARIGIFRIRVGWALAYFGVYTTKFRPFPISAGWALPYLWIILYLSKSVAALLYTFVAVPLILFTSPRTQFRAAALLAITALLYPHVRSAELVPVGDVRDWAASRYGEDRADSLMIRFINEDMLLERAHERSFFGWGTYCRRCVHDPATGEYVSISDGDWIITLGVYGWVGFLGKYLLLLLPILVSASRLKHVRRMSDRRLLSALALILGFATFDLLPNGNFNYMVFVFSGVLLSCSEGIVLYQGRHAAPEVKEDRSTNRGSFARG